MSTRIAGFLGAHWLWAAALFVVLITSLGARFEIKMGLSGDEPHYLVVANSIKTDHDSDVKNDYGQRRYLSYYKDTLEPHVNWALFSKTSEHWYSIHGPGLPILITPGLFVSKRLGPLLIMVLFGVLAAFGGILLSRTVAKERFSLLAGILMAASIPFLALVGYIFPDMVNGALVALIFAFISFRFKSLWRPAIIGILSAILIWIHIKTILIAGTLILIECVFIFKNKDGKPKRNLALAALLIPFLALTALLQFKFYQWFGVLTPNGIYKGNNQMFQLSPLVSLPAILADPSKGLLVLSPIWFCAVLGFPEWYRRNKQQLLLVLLVVVPSFLLLSTFDDWAGGWSPPARYTMLYLPILLPALALGLETMIKNAKLRVAAVSLIVLQIAISGAYVLLKTPWRNAGEPSPFILALENKLHLSGLPAIFFDSRARPTTAGVVVAVGCLIFGGFLWLLRRREAK